jgi:hypothetical protein
MAALGKDFACRGFGTSVRERITSARDAGEPQYLGGCIEHGAKAGGDTGKSGRRHHGCAA